MSSRMSPERIKAITDMKDRALAILDAEQGRPVAVPELRKRLGLSPADLASVRLLESALKVARDKDQRIVQIEKKRGLWRSAVPGQQPLPVAPPFALPTTPDVMAAWLASLSDKEVCLIAEAAPVELVRRWRLLLAMAPGAGR